MANAYLIRTELKKAVGGATEDVKTYVVISPTESKTDPWGNGDLALEAVVGAIREVSRFPVIEEVARRRVFIEDLRPLRNSLAFEKDGWKGYLIKMQ